MPIFIESRRRFSFEEPAWNVIKYDANGGDYRAIVAQIPGTKAVDFVGVHQTDGNRILLLLEVSDYALDPKAMEQVVQTGDLATEFAHKVRDTLAGLVLLNRTTESPSSFQAISHALIDHNHEFRLVLWLCDCQKPEARLKPLADTLNKKLKKLIRCHKQRPIVFLSIEDANIPNLQVSPVDRE